ncbi:MAG: phosphatidate cytidylyltransferase, partial [Flavobacterium sp.]
MNETLKRTISGAVYIALLLTSILFSTESFILLFGIFLVITIYEFSNLVNLNKVFSILFGTLLYSAIVLVSHYGKQTAAYLNNLFKSNLNLELNIQQLDLILLAVTIVVSIKCILFLFYDSVQKVSISSKYLYLLGYIT